MSETRPRHTRRFPLPPLQERERLQEFVSHSVGAVVMVCGLFALLGYMYFAGTADPQAHTRHFPIAVVDEDEGATLDTPIGPQPLALGTDLVGGLIDGNDWSKLDLKVVSAEEAEEGLADSSYYAVIRIPSEYSRDVAALMDSATRPGDPAPLAQVRIDASPRASLTGATVADRLADALQRAADQRMGPQILDKTRTLAQARNAGEISGAAASALAHPSRSVVGTWNPLPPGISNATLPMFYALVVILAGFTGAMIISNLLDARMGFLPIELGPLSVNLEVTRHNRLVVLIRKWIVTVVTAPLVSGIYLAIAHQLGVGGFSYWNAYWFSILGIVAVGFCAHSMLAALGSLGMLVNLVVFVILGIPTSGGATPPEMLPPFFRAIGDIEPMHQAYVGLRAIMFFDSRGAAGLEHAVWMLVGWVVLGLVGGLVVTTGYDRIGLHRQRVEERISPDIAGRLRRRQAA